MARQARTTRSKKNLQEQEDDGWESDEKQSDSEDVHAQDVAAARKRKSPVAKQREPDGGAAKTSPSPAKKRAKKAPADLHSLQLFDIVLQHGDAIPRAAKEWVQCYREDKDEATAKLLTLLVKSTGSLDEVTAEDVASGEVDELVQRLALNITEDAGIDPFTHRGVARTFPGNYRMFWDTAIREAAAQEVLFDGRLPDRIANTATALSCSPVRPFRYAGTVTAAQIVSSFVTVGTGVAEAREMADFQLQQEDKKKGKAAADRSTALRRQVATLHHRATELEQVTGVLFQGVFAHRFRDVDERVRCEVISAIGSWATSSPSTFLTDSYLKYLAWAQSDASAVVRMAAVSAIERLYQDSDNLPHLADFTGRFSGRFVELMSDIDSGVAAAGLKLLAVLVKTKQVPLSAVRGAYQLLADEDEAVRRGAAVLVVQLLEEQGVEAQEAAEQQAQVAAAEKEQRGRGRAGKKGTKAQAASAAADAADAMGADNSKEASQLEGLLLMMGRLAIGEDADPEAAERRASLAGAAPLHPLSSRQVSDLVGPLSEELPMLNDAQMLVNALGDEARAARRGRLANSHLAALVAALMERAAQQHTSGGRKGGRAAATAASERAALHQSGTVAMMAALPKLLGSFQSEPEVAAPLVRSVRSMKLELFALRQQEAAFKDLLDQVAGLFARHTHDLLLSEVAATLLYCARSGPAALQDAAARALRATCTSAAAKLSAAAAAVGRLGQDDLADGVVALEEELREQHGGHAEAGGSSAAPAALHSLLGALQRARHLLSKGARELAGEQQLGKAVQALLNGHTQGRDLGNLLASAAVAVGQLLMLWNHAALAEEAADAINDEDDDGMNDTGVGGRPRRAPAKRGPSAAAVSDLSSRRGAFTRALEVILEAPLPPAPGTHAGDGKAGAAQAAARRGAEELRDQSFCALVDLLLLTNGPALQDVEGAAMAAGRALVAKLWGHLDRLLEEGGDDEDEEGGGEAAPDGSRAASADARRKASARLALRRAQSAALLGRLLLAGCLPREQDEWLGARLVGRLADSDHPQVQEVAQGVCRELRRQRPAFLPRLYLSALKTAWEQVEDSSNPEGAMGPFEELALAVSSMYTGFGLSVPSILSIVEGGIAYGCEAPPSRLPFLGRGLAAVTPKLPQAEAQRLAEKLESFLSKVPHDPAADGWRDAHAYLEGLKSRGTGAKVTRGGLKAPGARSKQRAHVGFTPGTAAGTPARKRGAAAGGGGGGRERGRKQRRDEDQDHHHGEEEEDQEKEEDIEEDERTENAEAKDQPQPSQGTTRARGRIALAATTPPSLTKRQMLRSIDADLGPLSGTQTQGTQSQRGGAQSRGGTQAPPGSQHGGQGSQRGAFFVCDRREESGGELGDSGDGSGGDEDEDEDEAGGEEGYVDEIPTEEQLPPAGGRGRAVEVPQEDEEMEVADLYEGQELAGGEGEDEEHEEEEEQKRAGGGTFGGRRARGGVVIENSQGSLMVQVDGDTEDDAINVDEPPLQPRRRRRGRF